MASLMSSLKKSPCPGRKASGYATFLRYGRERMIAWGKKGGRPKLKTYSELMAEEENKREDRIPPESKAPEAPMSESRVRSSPALKVSKKEVGGPELPGPPEGELRW